MPVSEVTARGIDLSASGVVVLAGKAVPPVAPFFSS
jgi:hypothetical protein